MSTAFNGSQHAHSRLSAARFIGKRANATSNGNALAAHARIQHARTQIEIPRPRRKDARPLSPPLKARAKTKIQLVLQEICDWGPLNKLHLAKNGDFSPQTRGFTRKNPELTSSNRPQSQFSCKIARKVVAAAGRNTDPQINWGNGPKLWQAIGHSRANNDNPCAKQGSGPYHRNDERNPHVTEPGTTQPHDSANCERRYIQQLNRRQKRF